jgi:hypothetical protein
VERERGRNTLCVCVCVCERERERERESKGRELGREMEGDRMRHRGGLYVRGKDRRGLEKKRDQA